MVRGLEAVERRPGEREDRNLERDRRKHGNVLRDHAREAQDDRHGQDGAPHGEKRGVGVRVAGVARRAGPLAPSPAQERRDGDEELGAVEREQGEKQRVNSTGP